MKSLINYIVEATENIENDSIWSPDENEIKVADKIIKTPEQEAKEYKKYINARKKLWELEDQLGSSEIKLDDVRKQYREKQKELEEKASKLYADNKDKEAQVLIDDYERQFFREFRAKRDILVRKIMGLRDDVSKAKKRFDKVLKEVGNIED